MRVLLRDLAPGQKYAIQFRSNDGEGNVSDWSQVQTFTTTNDTMPPADVVNLTWYDSGSSFIGQWDKVTTNADGTPLNDFRDYHCNVSNGSTSVDLYVTGERCEFSQEQNMAAFGSLQTSLTLTVTARDLTYNESAHPAVVHVDPLNPPTPSAPTVDNYIGLLRALSDGLDNSGAAMPSNVIYFEVHVSATDGFTPDDSTYVGRMYPGGTSLEYLIPGLTYGTLYYVRLVAVNILGKKSGASAEGSGTPARITGLDIQDGQIAAEQINWTATNIPGGNAYYSTSQPTVPIGASFNVGDVWYDTDNAYTSYSWNGTTWALDPNVGFIPAQKLIAGTITGDRIAANFFDAALANIGTAFIDSAMIQSITAAQITAGTMTADVVISGRYTTALTGARREMNQNGFQAWDAGNNQTINLDGINNLLTGVFQTALSGRRLSLGAAGSAGRIDFFAPNGDNGFVYSYTESSGTIEAIQLGMTSTSTNYLWNRINFNVNDGANTEYMTLRSGTLELMYDRSSPNNGGFRVYSTTAKAGTGAVTKERFNIDNGGLRYWDDSGTDRFHVDGSSICYNDEQGDQRLLIDDNSFMLTNNNANGYLWVQWKGTNARMVVLPSNRSDTSARIQLLQPYSYGSVIRHRSTSTGASARTEMLDVSETIWMDVWAASFTVQSSGKVKTNVKTLAAGALDTVKSAKVKTFNRQKGKKLGAKDTDPVEYNDRTEIGLIAEEAPEQVVVRDENGVIFGLDLGSQIGLLTAALQELAAEVDALKKGNGK